MFSIGPVLAYVWPMLAQALALGAREGSTLQRGTQQSKSEAQKASSMEKPSVPAKPRLQIPAALTAPRQGPRRYGVHGDHWADPRATAPPHRPRAAPARQARQTPSFSLKTF